MESSLMGKEPFPKVYENFERKNIAVFSTSGNLE